MATEEIKPTSVKERDNLNLLELVCQLHSRALLFPSRKMHDAYIEARKELETRLSGWIDEGVQYLKGLYAEATNLETDQRQMDRPFIIAIKKYLESLPSPPKQ